MTDEEKKAAEIAEAEAKAEEEKANAEFEASLEGLSEEEKAQKIAEKEAKNKKSEIDYEAELKRERERREAAEKVAAEKDFKLREQRRKEKEEAEARGEIFEDEKPLTAKQLEEILQKDRQQTRQELQSEIIREKAGKLAGSEVEANLIIEIHKNRTFPEGMSLDEQLEESYAIANRKSLLAKNEELKRALRSKETKSSNVAGTHRDSALTDEPKTSSKDIQALKAGGFIWDGKLNSWKKETKDRVIIVSKDLKTRRVVAK